MSNSHFAKMPNITIPRSRFKMPFNHKFSFLHGKLVPADCFEVISGDSFNLKMSSLIRMSTPIAPIMDNIDCYLGAWFVPLRLLWSRFEEFYGAQKAGKYYFASNSNPGPVSDISNLFPAGKWWLTHGKHKMNNGSLAEEYLSGYLGKPLTFSGTDTTPKQFSKAMSYLKEVGYYLIWNEYFRAEQLQYAITFPTLDPQWNLSIGSSDSSSNRRPICLDFNLSTSNLNIYNVTCGSALLKNVNKKFDYFTASTISPLYAASPVTIPLGQYAPIVLQNTGASSYVANQHFDIVSSNPIAVTGNTGDTQPAGWNMSNATGSTGLLLADLSQATAATINSLRYAFAVQRYLERSNYGCNHFFEILAVHYGVTSPDSRLQRPEYLGGHKFRININQVLSNSGYAAGTTTTLGETGAVSVTSDVCNLFTKAFVEPGYVYVMLWTKQDRTYPAMTLREDIKTNKYEFYSPEFANLGDQEVLSIEIDNLTQSDNVFGYQEHWAEYRYRPDRVSGSLNPRVSGGIPYWTLAERNSAQPALSGTWIEEDRAELAACLKTGADGPDYIGDFYFDYTATREMPVYSVPGLIDHVGNM